MQHSTLEYQEWLCFIKCDVMCGYEKCQSRIAARRNAHEFWNSPCTGSSLSPVPVEASTLSGTSPTRTPRGTPSLKG